MAYSIPSKWRIYWGERWWCWKDDFAMNLLSFRQADLKSITLDELRGRLDEVTARIVFEPRTVQDCSFPLLVRRTLTHILGRWNDNRNAYTGMDEIAAWAWFVMFTSFLINIRSQWIIGLGLVVELGREWMPEPWLQAPLRWSPKQAELQNPR